MKLESGKQTVYFQIEGEWCMVSTPEAFDPESSWPCVIRCHGAGGFVRNGESDWINLHPYGFYQILVDAGFVVADCHATGDHWGCPAGVAAYANLFEHLNTSLSIHACGMMGGGLGGVVTWNAISGPLQGKIRSVILYQSPVSFESVVNSELLKWKLLTAYGIPVDTPNEIAYACLACNDPVHQTELRAARYGDRLKDMYPEILFLHGEADDRAIFEENPVRLSAVLKEAGVEHTLKSFPGIKHAVSTMGEPADTIVREYFVKTLSA